MKSEKLSNILKKNGFKNIELDSIIESKHILKRSGGNFRQYLFSFYDQNYTEYALRSDLSTASVIKFISDKNQKKTKWSYSGEAYRKQIKITNLQLSNKLDLKFSIQTLKLRMTLR